MRTREDIKAAIEAALRVEFPRDTVDISDGYKDNIHVLVVSRRFDAMSESVQTDMLWSLIEGAGLSEDEKDLISLIMPASPALLK
jgi:hypothetical protein